MSPELAEADLARLRAIMQRRAREWAIEEVELRDAIVMDAADEALYFHDGQSATDRHEMKAFLVRIGKASWWIPRSCPQ